MKKIFSILAVVILATGLYSQSPEKMSFQAVMRNSDDALVADQEVGMRISILQGSESGDAVYVETQSPSTNGNGLVSIEIGVGNSSDDFSAISWGVGPFFIKTETDLTGGADYTITGTSELLSVPFALHAKTAEIIQGGHYIGEIFGGGIVFWVSPDGQHGLVASLDDLEGGTAIPWSNVTGIEIGSSAQSTTDGAGNTAAIIEQAGHTNSAAKFCADFGDGGFDDWYLPALRELFLLTSQDYVIGYILDNDGDAATNGLSQNYVSPDYGRYWSSSEVSFSNAWYYSLSFSSSDGTAKSTALKVRAIRAY